MSAAEIFRTYLQRFTSGDTAGAAELLTDDFRFQGPFLRSQGKAEFLAGSAQLGPIMRGAEIHRQWEQGDEICSFYLRLQDRDPGRCRVDHHGRVEHGSRRQTRLSQAHLRHRSDGRADARQLKGH
jgi:hypothetical protein